MAWSQPARVMALAVLAVVGFGAAAAWAQTWSTAQLLNDPALAGADIKEASIVAAANGFHATYRVAGNSRIQYRRYFNGILKPAQDVAPGGPFLPNPKLGVSLEGTVHVVVEDWSGSGPEVRWYRFNVDDNTGLISNKVTQVLSSSGGKAKHPHITPYGLSGGQMLMSYYRTSPARQLWYAVYNGTSWSAEAPVNSACSSEYECFGQARAPDGAVWRSFTDAGTLKIRRFSGAWGPEIPLDSNGEMHNRQRLSVNDAGQVMVVWDENNALWSILHTPPSSNGAKTQITNQNSWFQGACAIPGTNNFQAGYPKNDPHPARCYSKRWNGASWQAEETVTQGLADAFTVQPELSAATDGSGTLYCIFEYWGSNKPQQYYAIKPGSPPGPTGTLAGFVRDQFGAGLVGASVSVAPQGATVSIAGGAYSFQVPVGTGSATATKNFYTPQTVTGLSIVQNQTTQQDFVLVGQPPGEVTGLGAVSASTSVFLQWNNPLGGNYSGTRILARVGTPPTGPTDASASLVIDETAGPGSHRSVTHAGLTNGQTYHYRAFTYFQDVSRFYSAGVGTSARPAMLIDYDQDGDIDQSDFSHIQSCLTGVNVPVADPSCNNANLDGPADQDVDATDILRFIECYSGPNVYAIPGEQCPY